MNVKIGAVEYLVDKESLIVRLDREIGVGDTLTIAQQVVVKGTEYKIFVKKGSVRADQKIDDKTYLCRRFATVSKTNPALGSSALAKAFIEGETITKWSAKEFDAPENAYEYDSNIKVGDPVVR